MELKIVNNNMIHSFSCKNFYSFGESATVSFVVNKNAPNNNGYFESASGDRLSKGETVVGPNASGKTNLLKVLPFLKWLIIDSFSFSPEAPIIVQSFAFGKNKNEPTELSAIFEINGSVYIYSFVLDKTKIISEELKLKNKTKEKVTTKKIFSRHWNEKDDKYEFEGKNFSLPKGFENLLRSNASVIGTAARLNHKKSREIAKFWQQVEMNVAEAGWVGDSILPNSVIQFNALNFFSDNQLLKEKAEKLISQYDLGLEGFEIKKAKKSDSISISVRAAHTFKGEKQYLPGLQYESSGTRQLLVLLKTILQVLESGGVAVLDEVDVNLHPEMIFALLDLFTQPESNPKNAQFLFSTHSHLALSKLDKYQIILVEKNKNGMSESWRLDEVAGVRADDNYYSKYIAGAYGAVPKL
jgi:uncharacterized protein